MICVVRGLLVAYGKKSLEEIFFKEWPEARNNSIQLASINIIFNENH